MLERFISELLGRGARTRLARLRALSHYESAERARAMAKLDDVEDHYRSAIALDPQAVSLIYNLGLLLQQLGDIEEAEVWFRRALELQPDNQMAYSSFLCIGDFSRTLPRKEIYRRHLDWAHAFENSLTKTVNWQGILAKTGRIRLGYVSADFHCHVTGRFIEPVLRYQNKSRFNVFCYNNLIGPGDSMTEHLKSLSENWRDIGAVTDEELAQVVLDDKIDILVDLSGHSLGNRLLTFARKPAPVQITWLGYLNTTGMEAMDYRLTDEVSDPPGVEQWYRERLLRLPHPQWCYVPDAGPVRAPDRMPVGRKMGDPLTFACMTRFMKVNQDMVNLWTRILNGVPGSKLRIVDVPNHARAAAFARYFIDQGLAGRVEFSPTLRADEYWNILEDIDIALDTFPYTGATTSCDCLWMGVPVVTLAGICGAARSATSILTSLGLAELSANSEEEYVDIAITLGRDERRRLELRESLRRRMLASPICDPILFTRNLERQLEHAWHLRQERARSHG